MIDERQLTKALEQLSASYELPENGRQAILDAAGESVGPPRTRGWARPPRLLLVAAAVVAVLGVAAALPTGGGQDNAATRALPAMDTADEAGVADVQVVGGQSQLQPQNQAQASAGGSLKPTSEGAAASAVGGGASPESGARVVKSADVQVEVGKGEFEPALDRLSALAVGRGGFVAQTDTSEGRSAATGRVTLRVPAAEFEAVVGEVRRLGKVLSASSRGQDVTAQYQDIEARLRGLRASRDQILTVLAKANTVGDILAVQERLNSVQVQIEQLQGQQKVLDDQTTFGTVAVHLAEPGARLDRAPERDGLAGAWDDARRGFVGGLEAIVRGSGTALILVLSLAAVAFATRGVWLMVGRRWI
ncbi:MAG: DUF4349 domain-containing protein [Actinobacteria bacterium]|nr:DUF4349 domain-containing protein [Actinomycetota bacterium]MBW3649110.1 DUF4349 domain-containing protein [Actinomycetota bacterium]